MRKLLVLIAFFMGFGLNAQENRGYQTPPKEILDLVDVELAPSVRMDRAQEMMVLLSRDAYKSIEELSQTELRLGGLRINPKTNIGSRTNYYNNLKVKPVEGLNEKPVQVTGLPEHAKLANFAWSPDDKFMAFTHTSSEGVELWLLDVEGASAKKLTEATLNANMGAVVNWFSDSKSILVTMLPADRKELIDVKSAVPVGPTISVSDGKKAQNRTYQDLLKNKSDEFNFEQLAHSELWKVGVDGKKEQWMKSDMYSGISFSPDGEYVMVHKIERPFSYLVPYYRFPTVSTVYTKDAAFVETVVEIPLIEDMPKGFMAALKGKRYFQWRADRPSTLVYAVALDEGDPANEVEYRDEIFELEAPFKGDGKSILKTINRFSRIYWCNDEIAIASDYWWNTRNTKAYMFNPSDVNQEPVVIEDRNYQDRYNDPGSFVTKRNEFGRSVIALKGKNMFLVGDGFTPEGQFPFVNSLNIKNLQTKTLYRSEYTDKLENLYQYDVDRNRLLVGIESPSEYPNYYFRNLKKGELQQITNFENPFKGLQDVHKEVISYKRDDGLDLSGTLYLPVGYDMEKKEKMPMILWAYPTEYKDKASAGQKTSNPNAFIYPYYGSMVYWVTRGYVVLDGASFPIVGEGEEEPNDTFREQLVANGKAAIDAVDALGYIDRTKVAVGGHSYGAFMVANLLSHSDLFACGIARSGAYNRTLTPFGFQSEERNYWEAPEVYYMMSPFMHADKMKSPLLMIHGEADNNSGTYPMQSTRYFNAIKGLGGTSRLVMLPKESHGYRAKESILHLLWEQDQWLEKYCK